MVGETLRPISDGAEEWLGKKIEVLDHGFVYLVDYMGNDQAIEQAARVSYGTGTRNVNETVGLIRYLMRHQHTTPFEMVELKFHAKMPIFVARQWVRHRTASINELSGRYSILDKEFYVPSPEVITTQSQDNKQGRGQALNVNTANKIRQLLIDDATRNYGHYASMLEEDGLAKELARMDLTLNFYTQWYWKANLHNTLRFLGLRMDPHAQWEIREYANAMSTIVRDSVPIAWKAFEDYQLNAVKLTSQEVAVLTQAIGAFSLILSQESVLHLAQNAGLTNKREQQEMLEKFKKMGLIK
jgi:thymidylate synthase (FAD)